MMWAGIAGAAVGAVLLVWAWIRRSQQMGAIEDASEAIGLIEAADIMREQVIRGDAKDAKALDAALDKAEQARVFIEKNQDKIKKEASDATLARLARLGY